MQRRGESIDLSPSDLMRFQGCAHATMLDLGYLNGEPLTPAEDTPSARLMQVKGDAHELAFLQTLRDAHKSIRIIDKEMEFQGATEATRAALAEGSDYIYQAALSGGRWGGFADFVERIDRRSQLGAFSYEVIDTKLKRSPDPKHVLQL